LTDPASTVTDSAYVTTAGSVVITAAAGETPDSSCPVLSSSG
jgi:hypothetical protein